MCGIIGIVTDPSPGVARDPEPLLALLRNHAPDSLQMYGHLAPELEEGIGDLFALGSVHQLLLDPDREGRARDLGQHLGFLAESFERQQQDTLSVERREHLSALALRFHDLSWRLLHDLLPNLDRIRKLVGEDHPSLPVAREGWKLNTVFNGLDRLEVRGRDSAGLSVQVAFPEGVDLEVFRGHLQAAGLLEDFEQRLHRPNFVDGAISLSTPVLTFAYKVAREIGELGENVASLRESMRKDAIFWTAVRLDRALVTPLAHTRWASNGIISEPNCHPLNNEVITVDGTPGGRVNHVTSAVLNGDIDNFQALKVRLLSDLGRAIAPEITTDAKSIPLWIDRHLEDGVDFEEAFRRAIFDFQGSMAIAVQTSREPGRIYLAVKGSGQSIYVGRTHGGWLVASELYGLVEETSHFWKMDGEKPRIPGDMNTTGQIYVLDPSTGAGRGTLRTSWIDGTPLNLPEGRKAEITTRDINRRGFRHFLLKEISEAVRSVKKTLEGKVDLTGPTFPFLREICPPSLLDALSSGEIRRVICIGQGTASIAGEAVAGIMQRLMRDKPLQIQAMKATELSGTWLRDHMRDTLVVAVSQSGTTTDTNRTVDMVRERGARVLAIVNRRNSDLTYKADAVLYTSDGRDIEMSVASTKAFYAQVTAGYLLALALAEHLQFLPREVLSAELQGLLQLPGLIGQVVAQPEQIKAVAERFAVRHRYWALVGSGLLHVSAQEIRIKLSELCYKAIPVDFTEDKKHIDLSSEPLILVCAAGLPPELASDVAKEVAIFKAHKAIPIVIASEGETRFDPYAAAVLRVPNAPAGVAFVLATVAGHLWGYYAAQALDTQAQLLRRLRARAVDVFEQTRGRELDEVVSSLRVATAEEAKILGGWLLAGTLDSGLTASTAVRLSLVLRVLEARMSLDDLYLDLGSGSTSSAEALAARFLAILTEAVDELTRPIDAIKHQAKTVTVGISRNVEPRGALFDALKDVQISADQLLPTHYQALLALTPLVAEVRGAVLYTLEHLDKTGQPGSRSTLSVTTKRGVAVGMRSRLEGGGSLSGTKREIVAGRRLFAGVGSLDGRSVVMFPLFNGAVPTGLLLLHVTFDDKVGVEQKLQALRHYRHRYDQIVAHFTEQNITWHDTLLEHVPAGLLFEAPISQVQEVIAAGTSRRDDLSPRPAAVWS